MESVKDGREERSPAIVYLEEQSALFRAGGYWNCLAAARKLSALLLAEGRRPWIARLRKREDRGEEVFHAPLVARAPGFTAAWTTHYVCCCDGAAYDPVAGKPTSLESYCVEVFGEQIPTEVFVAAVELPTYLADNRPTSR